MHLETKYERKLQKDIEKLTKVVEKLKKERSELKQSLNCKNKTIKRLISSRDNWKSKHKGKQKEIKNLKAKLDRSGKATGHKYDISVMCLCALLRIKANCSYGMIPPAAAQVLQNINHFTNTCRSGLDRNTLRKFYTKLGIKTGLI